MVDDTITDSKIKRILSDNTFVTYFRKYFYDRMSNKHARILIEKLCKFARIHASDISKNVERMKEARGGSFEPDLYMKDIVMDQLRSIVLDHMKTMSKEKEEFYYENVDENLVGKYIIVPSIRYRDILKLIYEEDGEVSFSYDFEKGKISTKENTNGIPFRKNITIIGKGILFDFPIEYGYECYRCHKKTTKTPLEVDGTGGSITCEGHYVGDDGKKCKCNIRLKPSSTLSTTTNAYWYETSVIDKNGNITTTNVISLEQLPNGRYDAVVYKLANSGKLPVYFVAVVNRIVKKLITIPEKKNENYLFTLQRALDAYIENATGLRIHGLLPIKVALIMQAFTPYSQSYTPIYNVKIVGSPSTGKSTILKYYGYLLHGNKHLSSNGASISVPAMRGTCMTISLMGKDIRQNTHGHLGLYTSIHIDEIRENPELFKEMKAFLHESTYGYDKVGSTTIGKKRTAHVNVSENVDIKHLGVYRGSIKKAYNDHNYSIVTGEDGIKWDESWDTDLPLHCYLEAPYFNPRLERIIRDKREEFEKKTVYWIDGYDTAMRERFPFYFYITNNYKEMLLTPEQLKSYQEKYAELDKISSMNGLNKNIVSVDSEMINVLSNDDVANYFMSCTEYHVVPEAENLKMLDRVNEILKHHDIGTLSPRMKKYYIGIVVMSRMLNQRRVYAEDDYYLLEWLLEYIGQRIDVTDTNTYELRPKITWTFTQPKPVTKTQSLFDISSDEFG